jgi:hypothetical protein
MPAGALPASILSRQRITGRTSFTSRYEDPSIPKDPDTPYIPGMAQGGHIEGRQPAIVGEEGPELYYPVDG